MSKKRIRDDESYRAFISYLNETGLESEIRSICLKHYVTPRDVYLDVRGQTVHAARLEIWFWLSFRFRKSNSEIASIFDREGTSVQQALRKVRDKSASANLHLPDRITEVARLLAGEALEAWTRTGNELAEFNRQRTKTTDGSDP